MAAKRPSKRRHRVDTGVELRLIPVLSLLVVLVPMLLQTAVFEQTAAIAVNLPSVDEVHYLQEPDPAALTQTLTLALTDAGFLLASGEDNLARAPRLADGTFDFSALENALERAKVRYPSQDSLVLLVEDVIVYDDVVHVMDRSRPWFPVISLADRVAVPGEE